VRDFAGIFEVAFAVVFAVVFAGVLAAAFGVRVPLTAAFAGLLLDFTVARAVLAAGRAALGFAGAFVFTFAFAFAFAFAWAAPLRALAGAACRAAGFLVAAAFFVAGFRAGAFLACLRTVLLKMGASGGGV